MTNHPIAPPPELVEQWIEETRSRDTIGSYPEDLDQRIANRAAQWGADQELEACCEWLDEGFGDVGNFPATLRSARRPKPPSLKEQALAVLEEEPEDSKELIVFDTDQIDIIRRAIEALPE
jgi:hypothetical protein